MAENVREIALDTLLELERGEEFSHRLIKAVLDKYDYLDTRDKAFIKRVTEGTIERQIQLDYHLNQVSSVPVRKMKPLIRNLLRMSAYQILFLDAVPDSAVCNEACKLAGKRKFSNLKGFVNGVLRSLSRDKERLTLPERGENETAYFSVRYSVPEWLVEYWIQSYGEETAEQVMKGLLQIHPLSLRFRRDLNGETRGKWIAELEEAGVRLRQSSLLPYVYRAENAENLHALPGFGEGVFTVQDASSALAVEAAGIRPGDFVLDLCAAPGGKSILAGELAGGASESSLQEAGTLAGRVLARDISEAKVSLIRESAERMGQKNVTVEVYDATVFDGKFVEKADVVLADLPCSGLGVLGKKRDIKYRVTRESLGELAALQKRILSNSWQYVKPGGVLLYSTCTINPAENEEMAAWIVEQFPFELEEQRQFLPGYEDCDGFFYARLRRRYEQVRAHLTQTRQV